MRRSPYVLWKRCPVSMPPSGPSDGPLSYLGITIRRAFVVGRLYFVYGTAMSVLLGIGLGSTVGVAFTDAYPLMLPIFAVVGAMGALTVFTNDRLKGVIEYLMAYGVSPRRQFANVLVASVVMATVLLTVALSLSLGFYVVRGHEIPSSMGLILVLYTIPMTYAAQAFATTVGMYWTAISSPRTGLTSPTGLAPFIGILPPVATLLSFVVIGVTGGTVDQSTFLIVSGLAMTLVAAVVGSLLALSSRLLRRERLLSPA